MKTEPVTVQTRNLAEIDLPSSFVSPASEFYYIWHIPSGERTQGWMGGTGVEQAIDLFVRWHTQAAGFVIRDEGAYAAVLHRIAEAKEGVAIDQYFDDTDFEGAVRFDLVS